MAAQGPGGVPDDDGPGRDVAGHDGSSPDERSPADRPSLEDDRPAADSGSPAQMDATADAGAREHGGEVLEDGVVPDRGTVLDLHVVPDRHIAAEVRERHDDAATAEAAVRTDDRLGMHQRPWRQTGAVELVRNPRPDRGVGDTDDVSRPAKSLTKGPDQQAADRTRRGPLVEERRHGLPDRDRDVESLPARAARAHHEQVHARQSASGRTGDLAVAASLLALGAWTAIGPPSGSTSRMPTVAAVALAGGGYAIGRLASLSVPVRTATALLMGAGAVLAVALSPGGLSGTATAPPLHYGNANGALVTLGVSAVLIASLSTRGTSQRLLGVGGAATLVPVAWLTGSQAATAISAALVVIGAGLALRPTIGRPLPALAALAVLGSLAATMAMALTGPEVGRVQEALTYRRVHQWAESVAMVEESPWRGRGVGSFAAEAPSALLDRDVRWSHSLWLQQAAETGLPGLALLLTAAGVVVLRIQADGWEDGGVPAMGAAVTAGMLLHGSVDYVFHFPVLLGATAVLAGLTLAPRRI